MNDKEVVKIALKKEIDFLTLKCYNEGVTLEEQHRASLLMKELSHRGKKEDGKRLRPIKKVVKNRQVRCPNCKELCDGLTAHGCCRECQVNYCYMGTV